MSKTKAVGGPFVISSSQTGLCTFSKKHPPASQELLHAGQIIFKTNTVRTVLFTKIERLDMKYYNARCVVYPEVPLYIKDIPLLLPGYHEIVELVHSTLRKRRLVACSDTTAAN